MQSACAVCKSVVSKVYFLQNDWKDERAYSDGYGECTNRVERLSDILVYELTPAAWLARSRYEFFKLHVLALALAINWWADRQ